MLRRVVSTLVFCALMGGSLMASAWPYHHHGQRLHLPKKSVPELDGSMAGVALALIGGGLAVAHGRRRRARS